MPRSADRGGADTRARIAEHASGLFLEHGFDAVTVADVARAAGVSSVTVFKHFPKKEDLFLDRAGDAADLLRETVQDRGDGVDVVEALRAASMRLLDQRTPLSGTDPRSVPFFRTVAASPSLVARARELAAGLQRTLQAELEADEAFAGDAVLLAALLIAGYAAAMTATARRVMAGEAFADLDAGHRARLERLFESLRPVAAG